MNDLFSLYPVLERRINEIIQNAIDIYKEVIERIEKDADVLMKNLISLKRICRKPSFDRFF